MVDPVSLYTAGRIVSTAFSLIQGGQLTQANRGAFLARFPTPYAAAFANQILGPSPAPRAPPRAPPPETRAPPPRLAVPPLVINPVPAPPPAPVTGEELFEEILRRRTILPSGGNVARAPSLFEELIRDRTFVPTGGTFRAVGAVARGAARVLGASVGVLIGVLDPSDLGDATVPWAEMQRRQRRGPPRRPGRARRPPPRPLPPIGVLQGRPLGLPAQPRIVVPAPRPIPEPVPTTHPVPAPVPAPRSVALPRPVPAPRTLPLTWPLALVAPFVLPSSGSRAQFSQPLPRLPVIQPLAPSSPPTSSPSLPAPRAPFPLTAFQPSTLASPRGEPPCECKGTTSRKKRQPKKPREVCYAGEYRERARGLTKERRRKIPCQ